MPLPKPRIEKLVLVERCNGVTRSVGTRVCKSVMSITLACSIALLLTTVMATGDSCNPFARLDAVTTILSISSAFFCGFGFASSAFAAELITPIIANASKECLKHVDLLFIYFPRR